MKASHKNILIIFDAAGHTPVSMQIVIELAVRWRAGIQAVYIEDINLLKAVELPFTREISLHTAEISSIDSTLIMQRLRTDAENIKNQIMKIAVNRNVSLSFSSTHDQKTQVIKNCAEEVNMVLIPAVYTTMSRKEQHRLKRDAVIVYDDDNPLCKKALDIAASQAVINGYQLFVIVNSQLSEQRVKLLIGQQSGHATCQIADLENVDEILLLIQKHAPELLVLAENSHLIGNEQMLQHLINSLESDILLVR